MRECTAGGSGVCEVRTGYALVSKVEGVGWGEDRETRDRERGGKEEVGSKRNLVGSLVCVCVAHVSFLSFVEQLPSCTFSLPLSHKSFTLFPVQPLALFSSARGLFPYLFILFNC